MPASSPIRILIYGLDADLQMTREMLLTEAGYATDSAENWSECRARLDRDDYRLVILCHTVPTEQREECEALAFNKKMWVYALPGPIAPHDLLRQIAEFVSA
jgi:DNA-binding response OmpR family regulator